MIKIFTAVKLLLDLAFRNVLRNRRRSIITFLSVVAGVGSSIVLAALARGLSEQMIKDAIYNLTGHIQLHAPGYTDDPTVNHSFIIDKELKTTLEHLAPERWAERVRVPAVIRSEREALGVTMLGIDPEREAGLSMAGDRVSFGSNLSSAESRGIIVGEELLELLETEPGKRVVLMTQDREGNIADQGFKIIGVFKAELEATERSFVFIALNEAQELLKLTNRVSEISLLADKRENVAALKAELSKKLTVLEIKSWPELEPLLKALTKIQDGFLSLWFVVVMIAVSFGLINTIFMSIYERVRELGVMQAIGMSPRLIIGEIVLESAYLLFAGALVGVAAGFLGVYLLGDGLDISVFAKGAASFGLRSVIYPHVLLKDVVLISSLILSIGCAGSVYPAWYAARKSPVEAMRKV